MWKPSRTANSVGLAAIVVLTLACPFVSGTSGQGDSSANRVALNYLRSVDKSASFVLRDHEGEDTVFIGSSTRGGWRVIIVHRDAGLGVIWDSQSLRDPYFTVTASNTIETQADKNDDYLVTIRGCAPHQCADGKIGFAVYASKTRKTYIAHVLTGPDGSYHVTYKPNVGLPPEYRQELDRLMCADNGISRPATLPIKCQSEK